MRWAISRRSVPAIALGWVLPAMASAVGIQALTVPADGSSPALSGGVWYPCAMTPTEMQVGPFTISASKDCALAGTNLPLIVISHGRTGSFLGHWDIAQALADAGFVVAAITHPHDNAQDTSQSDDLSVFVERPADIERLVDYMLGPWRYASAVDPNRIGLFGFSRGGYTGLVLVGANPRFDQTLRTCIAQTSTTCEEALHGRLAPLVHDRRIKAAVIADPLSIFFTKSSFEGVDVPIQLWRSEHGGDGVTPESVATVAGELPVKPDFHTVSKARHFSFLPPCSAELAQLAREICTDEPGFDRVAFHKEFNAQVVNFFRQVLR